MGCAELSSKMPWRMANYLNDQSDTRFARMFGLESSLAWSGSNSPCPSSIDCRANEDRTSKLPTTVQYTKQQRSDFSELCNGRVLTVLPSTSLGVLECPFLRITNCPLTYSDETDWIHHSLSHFNSHGRYVEPPNSNNCRFCDENFHSAAPYQSWFQMMWHTSFHHIHGDKLSHTPPEYSLLKYLFDHRILSDAEYRHLKSSLVVKPTPSFSYFSKDCVSINKGRRGQQSRRESTCQGPKFERMHRPIVHNGILFHTRRQVP